uniref:Uncharacterized protein n=1 Tax=Anguilla anguilla TaxID=7936 RepID=A0A0E9U026_ANGAN
MLCPFFDMVLTMTPYSSGAKIINRSKFYGLI